MIKNYILTNFGLECEQGMKFYISKEERASLIKLRDALGIPIVTK